MNELVIVANVKPGLITFNYEETKERLKNILVEYKGARFSDESIQVAKSINAELRKEKAAFDTRRKDVKKEYMISYEEFDTQAKELISLFDEPINFIDEQVKGYEERKKAEKQKKIETIYEDSIGDMIEYLPLSKIFDPKWLNAGSTIKAITEEITKAVESIRASVNTISAMNSDSVVDALKRFKADLSLVNAITYVNSYEQQKAEIVAREQARIKAEEEAKALREIEKVKREEREKVEAEARAEKKRLADIEHAKEEAKAETEKRLIGSSIRDIPIKQEEPEFEELEEIEEDLEASFDSEEEAFLSVDEIKSTFIIIGSAEELGQVEMYLNSIGLVFDRKDD